jgi:hypothetical protein
MKASKIKLVMGLSVLLVALTASTRAHANWATFTSCTVAQITVDGGGGFYIDCVGTTSRFANWPGRCAGSAVTTDTMKTWESLATAALLSGKPLNIVYDSSAAPTTCPQVNGTFYLGGLVFPR